MHTNVVTVTVTVVVTKITKVSQICDVSFDLLKPTLPPRPTLPLKFEAVKLKAQPRYIPDD